MAILSFVVLVALFTVAFAFIWPTFMVILGLIGRIFGIR